MSRILMLGLSPLPIENETHTLGPGKRTWQFTRSLLDAGHRVCLICSRHLAAYQTTELEPVHAEEHGNLIYYSLAQEVFENIAWLQRIHDHFEPDCIVGASVYPSFIASKINTDKPIWSDLFGHIMAEAQTKSQVFNDDYYISQMWRFEQSILDRSDIFSVVSSPQAYATIGELGTRGRLNRATTGYQFIRVIPCAINDESTVGELKFSALLRGVHVERDDFVLLWSGGYNTWTDVDTLFHALERVFERIPNFKFVSTGGQIESHDELTYQKFLNMIDRSKYKDRFIMRGWIPFSEVPHYWQEADAGINIDSYTYEAILGSRNRILDWMQMGLPVVTTELCELSKQIKENNLGYTFLPESVDDLANVLIRLSGNREELAAIAQRARDYAETYLTINATAQPLVDWAANPVPAPDFPRINQAASQIGVDSANRSRHYVASIANQLKYKGIAGTMRWILGRYLTVFQKTSSGR